MSSESIPGDRADADEPGLIPAFTFAVWAACLAVGLTGLLSQPAGPPPPTTTTTTTTRPAAQVVSVTLEAEPSPPQPRPIIPAVAAKPVPVAVAPVPTAALPSPAIAFAVPVVGPARVGPVACGSAPVVRQITFGRGEGDQPAPDYPDAARAAGQQGVVVVRLSIGPDGRVGNAWAVAPSPFPLLNRSATDAVRDTWHFAAGPPRLYDVPITFRLNPAD